MTDQLALYQMACRHLSQERISSLTEDVFVKRELDAVYAEACEEGLEEGYWRWALRAQFIETDPDVETSFGLAYAFTPPDDLVAIQAISSDDHFNVELEGWSYEGGYIYSDLDSFYIRYVSNDVAFGMDLGKWPMFFAKGVSYLMAEKAALPILKDRADRNDYGALARAQFSKARIKDAVNNPVRRRPAGRLVSSRFGFGRLTR